MPFIQLLRMDVLEFSNRQLGKSLSLICGALTWLREHKSKSLESQLKEDEKGDGAPDWVKQFARDEKKQKLLQEKADMEARLAKIRDKEKREKQLANRSSNLKIKRRHDILWLTGGQKGEVEVEIDGDGDEAQFCLDDYESGDEDGGAKGSSGDDTLSPAIFYCSRTHSQLTQFINELRRVTFPPPFPEEEDLALKEEVKHLSLGSRKNLCINPKVTKLGSPTAINERCLELQRSGTSEASRCEFLPGKDDQVVVRDFRDHTLAKIRDIEDLASLGKKMGVCPYYASRPTIKPSEEITLPYPLLLQKSAREALDLSLKGHVVIIDEAHNLMNAISSIYSIAVSLTQLRRSQAQLDIYLSKFKNRLKGKNKVYVMQTVRIIASLASYLEEISKKSKEGIIAPGDLLAMQGIDQVNFYKLQTYLNESKLARKVEGYIVHKEAKEQENNKKLAKKPGGAKVLQSMAAIPVLTHIQSFLLALTNPSAEGKIFHGKTEEKNDPCLKYMLLDPAHHFQEIVEEARAVILAGGTMEPMNDYTNHLFPYLPKEKIRTLSCGHVIPEENLTALPVTKGPGGREFEFTFEKRMQPAMIEELGRAIVNLCQVIPHGVVCFFPSYAYLEFVVSQWRKKPTFASNNAAPKSLWERLEDRKTVFRESSDGSSVEEVLREYAHAIDNGKGGLLLSVVGGKMSEGINFNDNLGRGIIMVGLPFPNSNTAEWRARLEHVEKAAGREFYENACMRAVNQSIGRAIRHREDYAVIALFDRRYSTERIASKLPKWIQNGLVRGPVDKAFGEVMAITGKFFKAKNA
ncbi:DNA repair helicase [Choiromyces venosus 120613-1]|uniref:ATP-dependent DNA helicase CHL1 n=1 Tax=Choiromyces venosus 120613-1 TaxID=1336337 RepID=A0A3N4JYV2_9PEZI|nr:DNA repair helicase [Choiromyces venosus 120613-1]